MKRRNRTLQTNAVGLLLGYNPAPVDPFASQLTSALLSRLNMHQKRLLFYGEPYHASVEAFFEEVSQHCDGLIFIPPTNGILPALLVQSGFPAVGIADRCEGLVSVNVDDEMGAFMLAEHLSIRGHRKVMYRKDLLNHDSAARRFHAFYEAAKYLGIEVIPTLPANIFGAISAEEEGLLRAPQNQRLTAVVSWSDNYSYPVLKFCKQHRLDVPKDIAVAGFDGSPSLVEPVRRLTTIQAPWLRVAEKAVDLLVQLIRGEEVPHENTFPVDLVIGDTS